MSSSKDKATHWSAISESGTEKGILFLYWLNRVFGRRLFDIVLYPVVLYFYCVNATARRASRQFLNQHAEVYPQFWSTPPGALQTLKHMYTFGQSILDKALGWSTDVSEDDFEVANPEILSKFLEKDTGQLIIGSHFGNLEYCRSFVQHNKVKVINALVYDQHSANFVNAMAKLNPMSRMNVFQVSELDVPLILKLKAKIEQGEWIFIAGDRAPLSGESNTVEVEFFERKTQLPIGPYILAKVLQCEVQLMFAYRSRSGRKVYFELVPFAEKIKLPRKDDGKALREYAQKYASSLELQVARVPYQWFNFYPYWNDLEIDAGAEANCAS